MLRGRRSGCFHLDLYRLETEEQIAVLGLDEMAGYENALVLVEWGERFESVVKMASAEIYIEHGDGDERGMIVRVEDLTGNPDRHDGLRHSGLRSAEQPVPIRGWLCSAQRSDR